MRLIAGFALHHRQPADLQLGAGGDQEVGAAGAGDQRGPGIDAVRILQGGGGDEDLHLVTADFPRQGAPFGHRGEDLERRRGRHGDKGEKNQQKTFHDHGLLELVGAVGTQAHDVL